VAEEEPGFTFVDKRKVVAAEDSAEPQATPEETPSGDAALDDLGDELADDMGTDEMPNVYDVLQYCVKVLAGDAWQKMGLLADMRTGVAHADLSQAKVAIDAVGDLLTRIDAAPDTAVTTAERREMRNLLNDLRLNFVNQRTMSEKSGAA
jgi:hypothetical protein